MMNIPEFYPIFQKCNAVQIDSRNVEKNDLFFAFSGKSFNAAALADDAIAKGAIAAIVELKEYANEENNIFYVPSTLDFLQDLAKFHRAKLTIPIIGLTGSNGKTTTKELMHAVLSAKYKVLSTVGNYNNHIGVPLTLLSIKPDHEVAVVEMGANHQKEIAFLCEIAQPTLGYITNFGKAHLEGFGGFEGVIKGKSEMFQYLKENQKFILINETDPIQAEKSEDYSFKITFGRTDSHYFFQSFSEDNFVGLDFKGKKVLSHLTGKYNFSNLSAAIALGFHFKIDFELIKSAIENYIPTNMRSQVVMKGEKKLLLDTYNANPSSMLESLKNFHTFPGTKTIIIGDMLELGEESGQEHIEILKVAYALDFNQIITVGSEFQKVKNKELNFLNTPNLIEYLKQNKISSKNILLKASRGIALENIIPYLD